MNYMKLHLKLLYFCVIVFASAFFVFSVEKLSAQTDLGGQCAAVSEASGTCPNLSKADCQALLQKCADYYDKQSAQLAADLTKTSAQKSTLQSQITGLKSKINALSAEINRGSVMVKDLNIQISDTEVSIDKTSQDIEYSRNQLVAILQSVYEEDKKPAFIILLEGNLSDFFSNLAYLDGLNEKVADLLDNTVKLKAYLEDQHIKMNENVTQLQKTIALQTLQKKQNEANKKEQDLYLKLTEAQYQQQLQDKQTAEKNSAKIKAQLFQTIGVSKAPTFGEALEIAKVAGSLVGIRPAFLLAIISQESALGRNVGQCYLVDATTGSGKKISTGASIIRVMNPTRDVPVFLNLTASSGRDPYNTPISCWITDYRKGIPYGWGGAMGPAQFIPSTWNGISGRLNALLGYTADPWAIKDSFTASGLYLADLGASAKTTTAENKAAARYYGAAGSYNSMVMTRATCIQTFIDGGTMSTYCQGLIF